MYSNEIDFYTVFEIHLLMHFLQFFMNRKDFIHITIKTQHYSNLCMIIIELLDQKPERTQDY